jgi:hypothetical protein
VSQTFSEWKKTCWRISGGNASSFERDFVLREDFEGREEFEVLFRFKDAMMA